MAAREDESDLFMSVRLDDGRRICKMLVSSQTTGQNVIELLKPDDDNVYYLVEIWKGCERPIAHEEKLKNVLLQWGSDVDDVVFMLKRKHSSSRQNQKASKSPRNSPVPEQLQEKQKKVENLEKEVQQKEKHLKSLRNKETSKSSLKTKYVRLLESKVIEQDEKLMSLQSVQDELFKCRVDNEKLVLELNRLRSMFVLKHQQLAEATTRVELLNRELAKTSERQDISKDNSSLLERNLQNPPYNKANIQSDLQLTKQLANQPNQRLTEAQLLQLQANNGYATSTLSHNGQQLGKDILFLKHGILHEHHDLNGLLSWQNDEENDTETSADSGHVSNDSPSYQNRLGPSFQFYPNPPEMYCAKVERFDIDQELGKYEQKTQERVGQSTLRGLSEVDGWSQLQQKLTSHTKDSAFNSVSNVGMPYRSSENGQNYNQQLFVNIDPKQGGVGPFSKQQQLNRDSPQSISSLSSLSSESSKNEPQSFPGQRLTKPSDSVMATNEIRKAKANRNPGSQTTTPTSEYKSFPSNEDSSDANRTVGSISHYQRKRGDSLDNTNPLPLPPVIPERTSSLSSNSSTESSSRRVRTPSIDKSIAPNSLMIDPKANNPKNGHKSPTVTDSKNYLKSPSDSKVGPNFNKQVRCESPKSKNRSTIQETSSSVVQNGRSSPMVLDLTTPKTNLTQQAGQRRKSPLSKERFLPGDPVKGRTSPGTLDSNGRSSPFDPKIISSNNSGRSSPLQVNDPKGQTSRRLSDTRVEKPAANMVNKPDKGSMKQQPLSSPGVQDMLNDMTTLKVTAREVKPIQIQTRAEKDSDNIPVEKVAVETSSNLAVDAKLLTENQTKPHKAPKPLPRKRTKAPPARGSGGKTNLVVTSSQQNTEMKSSLSYSKSQVKSADQGTGPKPSDGKPGTRPYDSILRKSKGGTGKKSGKRVSLDPHAVLLHASLEGELELVKNIIHQVEDPSYPNNEGLTALHHAVCNSHDDIVKFLVEYGCDINAADMQGWTSLHCAAANNSIDMCKFLVNHGACVFAVTAIEGKTPSRCCERDSENYEQCFSYLSDLENDFGISNEGVLYAVYAYQATRKDELSFECGERLTVIRRGDVTEKEWWWARDTRNQFGYIPRNLLGLHPPVAPDV